LNFNSCRRTAEHRTPTIEDRDLQEFGCKDDFVDFGTNAKLKSTAVEMCGQKDIDSKIRIR